LKCSVREVLVILIHQIFSLARNLSRRVTRPSNTQQTGEFSSDIPSIFKTACVAKNIWRIINTIASIWDENMLGYLTLDITWSLKVAVFLEFRSGKTVHFSEQITPANKYPSIFPRQIEAILIFFRAKRRLLLCITGETLSCLNSSLPKYHVKAR